MNIFNIIGPRMIGPSSSHTAGAVRLGNVAHKVMHGQKPVSVRIELSGSFASTYQGHGTDRALIAGILGYKSDDVEIRNIFEIAKERGLKYEFIPTHIPGSHPNTARITYMCENGDSGEIMGASVGGGNIRIDEINGLRMNLTAENTTLLVVHNDTPGVIANVTQYMYENYGEMNICNFSLTRDKKGGHAMMSIELDNAPSVERSASLKKGLCKLDHVLSVVVVDAI